MSRPHQVSRRAGPIAAGVAFALAPCITLGFLTPVAFGLVASWLRSRLLWVATAVFAAGAMAMLITSSSEDGTTADAVFHWGLGINFVGGGILAVVLTPWLIRRLTSPPEPVAEPAYVTVARQAQEMLEQLAAQKRAAIAHDPALRFAVNRQERRRFARQLVAENPALADELKIGRPDLSLRDFDDGGLIDVNHVPRWVFTMIDGIDQDLARRIVAARDRFGPFVSGDDLIVYAEVPPEVVERAEELLLFRQP